MAKFKIGDIVVVLMVIDDSIVKKTAGHFGRITCVHLEEYDYKPGNFEYSIEFLTKPPIQDPGEEYSFYERELDFADKSAQVLYGKV